MPVDVKLQTKFQLLLNKFMIQDHQVIDDTCLEKLLTHLSKEEYGPQLLLLPECRGFCECSLQAFEKGIVGESLLSFSLRLHGLILRNEKVFTIPELQENTKNITLSPRWMVTNNASLQYSFVQMVAALLLHQTGIEWLKNSVVWRTVKKLYEKNSSIYVARECQNFLSQFALRINSTNKEVAEEILKGPLDALTSNKDDLTMALDLLASLLELAFKENERSVSKSVEQRLSKICDGYFSDSGTDRALLTKLAKIKLLLIFCSVEPNSESLEKLEENSLQLIGTLITLKNIPAVQAITAQCQVCWKILKPRVDHLDRKFQFHMQIVYIQLMAVLKNKFDDIEIPDAIKNFLEKLCNCTSGRTQITGCRFRKLALAEPDHHKIACRSIHSLLQLKDVYERETAVYVFRALMCIVVQLVSSTPEEISEIQGSGLMRSSLEALIKMMDHFHFTWAESVETTDILCYMQDLLCESTLKDRQVSLILQIIRRAVEDFLPHNLALLTNTVEGSTLKNLGPQLFKCLHSLSWEVRDSALEVVAVMARISADKFPAFQEHLVQHNLCSLSVAMASGDEESYVRVSALNCLVAMVAVDHYWDRSLQNLKIPDMLTKILCQDSEGLVRQQAAKLVTAMLLNDRLKPDEKQRMYLVMATAAATDFHWEVKINVLEFWESTINQHLACQGMIDGCFPEVTFSGSSRRIVTLDKKEVKIRLLKVLEELAQIRCLAVLLSTLIDPDLHVTRKSAEILKNLFKHLEEYEVLTKNLNQVDPPIVDLASDAPIQEEISFDDDVTMANSDSVIDDIIEMSDLALLATVCQSQLSLEEQNAIPSPQGIELVKAEDFLMKSSAMDLDKIVSTREDWLFNTSEHLESLLTDMLEAREFKHNTNGMDCY